MLKQFSMSIYTDLPGGQKQAMVTAKHEIIRIMAQDACVAVGGWEISLNMDGHTGRQYVCVTAQGEEIR